MAPILLSTALAAFDYIYLLFSLTWGSLSFEERPDALSQAQNTTTSSIKELFTQPLRIPAEQAVLPKRSFWKISEVYRCPGHTENIDEFLTCLLRIRQNS
ncbi:MAG: hypothetical protein AAF371_12615 [Pseudomonadota bacterium]